MQGVAITLVGPSILSWFAEIALKLSTAGDMNEPKRNRVAFFLARALEEPKRKIKIETSENRL